jgi:hypothetical protein
MILKKALNASFTFFKNTSTEPMHVHRQKLPGNDNGCMITPVLSQFGSTVLLQVLLQVNYDQMYFNMSNMR